MSYEIGIAPNKFRQYIMVCEWFVCI